MLWRLSYRADPRAAVLADRHYSRQSVGAAQFVPPGRCLVLVTEGYDALWVTSAPLAAYVRHAWPGAWINSLFRREPPCPARASELIREAVAATRWTWPDVPALGLVSFVDPAAVRSTNPGFCYACAGFRRVGRTAGGLVAWRLPPEAMPAPEPPLAATWRLELGA